jgi:hypothetical protein
MPAYRISFLDRSSGRTVHQYRFHAHGDEEAVAFAGVWDEEAPMELSRGERVLRRWEERSA